MEFSILDIISSIMFQAEILRVLSSLLVTIGTVILIKKLPQWYIWLMLIGGAITILAVLPLTAIHPILPLFKYFSPMNWVTVFWYLKFVLKVGWLMFAVGFITMMLSYWKPTMNR